MRRGPPRHRAGSNAARSHSTYCGSLRRRQSGPGGGPLFRSRAQVSPANCRKGPLTPLSPGLTAIFPAAREWRSGQGCLSLRRAAGRRPTGQKPHGAAPPRAEGGWQMGIAAGARSVDIRPMAALVLGLTTIGIATWVWSSRRVHDYFWDAARRGPRLPAMRLPETRDRAVVGIRLAAVIWAAAGVLLVAFGLVTLFA
jgi:hypothetical protein